MFFSIVGGGVNFSQVHNSIWLVQEEIHSTPQNVEGKYTPPFRRFIVETEETFGTGMRKNDQFLHASANINELPTRIVLSITAS